MIQKFTQKIAAWQAKRMDLSRTKVSFATRLVHFFSRKKNHIPKSNEQQIAASQNTLLSKRNTVPISYTIQQASLSSKVTAKNIQDNVQELNNNLLIFQDQMRKTDENIYYLSPKYKNCKQFTELKNQYILFSSQLEKLFKSKNAQTNFQMLASLYGMTGKDLQSNENLQHKLISVALLNKLLVQCIVFQSKIQKCYDQQELQELKTYVKANKKVIKEITQYVQHHHKPSNTKIFALNILQLGVYTRALTDYHQQFHQLYTLISLNLIDTNSNTKKIIKASIRFIQSRHTQRDHQVYQKALKTINITEEYQQKTASHQELLQNQYRHIKELQQNKIDTQTRTGRAVQTSLTLLNNKHETLLNNLKNNQLITLMEIQGISDLLKKTYQVISYAKNKNIPWALKFNHLPLLPAGLLSSN